MPRSKDTPEVRKRFLALVRAGHATAYAAKQMGVSDSAVMVWAAKDPVLREQFRQAVAERDRLRGGWRRPFLKGVRRGGSAMAGAREARVPYQTVLKRLKNDPFLQIEYWKARGEYEAARANGHIAHVRAFRKKNADRLARLIAGARETGCVTGAARAAGVHRQTVYRWAVDPAVAHPLNAALEQWRRAHPPGERPSRLTAHDRHYTEEFWRDKLRQDEEDWRRLPVWREDPSGLLQVIRGRHELLETIQPRFEALRQAWQQQKARLWSSGP